MVPAQESLRRREVFGKCFANCLFAVSDDYDVRRGVNFRAHAGDVAKESIMSVRELASWRR